MEIDLKEEVKITAGNIHKYLVELLVIHWNLVSAYSGDFGFDLDVFDKINLSHDKFIKILNAIEDKIKECK